VSLAAQQAASTPDPYIVALIAVGGTALGALILGIGSAISARRTSERQRIALQMQLDHQTTEAIRQERRSTYAAFLDAMERWNLLVNQVYRATIGDKELLTAQAALWDTWREAFCRVQLVAGRRVEELASGIFEQYVDEMEDAKAGRGPDPDPHGSHRVFPISLIAAMQAELGITDGIRIDPKTRLRARDADDSRHA
jgi:hypothetical protein